MPSSNPDAPNASGLAANETKALEERSIQPHEESIIQSIKEMYTCKPKQSTYEIYSKDAVFHDPIGIANGKDSIIAQFNALAKIFPKADIPKFRLLQNPSSVPSSTLLIDQDVAYYRNPDKEPTKVVNSLLTLETSSGLVTRHTEEWDHRHEPASGDGFFGFLNEQRKKATAAMTDMFTSKEPPKKE
ncbi:hypothetical protein PUNSTDRAFT_56402 [Punctularia strigosozonata HHB-11173 SS5]|uniref:uncharacterized protein n=1 Tax=Punctularia strigosozonata (strain HHB-11173) TaxID=741275 RepID=UPI00044172B5|nr:uncharacterized protein PUNSTDRAFT_56402 [Punctularia strigosozonata HHB-11173 SS5]EIN13879.1 hypothetical protein PUNSTDRAFT_56402 [Punctularia strigosozonata HHB-11173 SS5]